MGTEPRNTTVAERLRDVQGRLGLTIQDIANRCGMPKRSLENYMNMKDPQRPGVDALMALADGLGVSIDWLVGRSDRPSDPEFSTEDYAVFCHSVVLRLLGRVLDAEEASPGVLQPPDKIMGHDHTDLAAWAVLDFTKIVQVQSGNPNRPLKYFHRSYDTLARVGLEVLDGKPLDSFPYRKP